MVPSTSVPIIRSMCRYSCDILFFHPFKLETKKEVMCNLFKPSFPECVAKACCYGAFRGACLVFRFLQPAVAFWFFGRFPVASAWFSFKERLASPHIWSLIEIRCRNDRGVYSTRSKKRVVVGDYVFMLFLWTFSWLRRRRLVSVLSRRLSRRPMLC